MVLIMLSGMKMEMDAGPLQRWSRLKNRRLQQKMSVPGIKGLPRELVQGVDRGLTGEVDDRLLDIRIVEGVQAGADENILPE